MAQIRRSLHGHRLVGVGDRDELISKGGFVAGLHGSQVAIPGSPAYVSFFDDFLGGAQAFSTTIIDGFRSRKGSDAQCVDFTVTEAVNGTCVGTIGDTTASMAVSGVQLDRGLDIKANQGGVYLEGRIKMSQITLISVFFGFTDQVGALEMPIQSAAGAHTITTNATDAVGFLFDTSDTSTDQWLAVGVANDVDATVQSGLAADGSAIVPVANTYETFRIELSAAGVASFFRNGIQVGSLMSGAVTPTVALTPVFAGFNRDTSNTPALTIDYLAYGGLRA